MTKTALCVGNNYPGTNAELSGCVNDAYDWSEVLGSLGYDVTLKVEATKSEVLDRLYAVVGNARYGDRIVFTFSGHGSWIPDQNSDELDRRDEVLCMADFMEGGLLSDDELHQVFSHLPFGSGALFLPDSCHSGTVSRMVGNHHSARYLSPANFTDMSSEEVQTRELHQPYHPRAKASLISGCSDSEFSYDAWFDNRANGAFTRAAIDAYELGISLNTWFKYIREELPNEDFPQTPQLTYATLYRKYAKAL